MRKPKSGKMELMMIIDNSSRIKTGKKIQAVIFDWAGTTIDYGCFAPVEAFISSFKKYGIELSIDEVRAPMGLPKKVHIKKIISGDRVEKLWVNLYGRFPEESDIDAIYLEFDTCLRDSVMNHVDIKPYTLQAVESLRRSGIKIGSTTGYTKETMDMILPEIKKNGYSPDCVLTPDNLPAGRPFPWMCYQNAINLNVFPMNSIIKVGDTASDIEEGVNSGCWTIGVVYGSSEMGLSLKDEMSIGEDKFKEKRETAVSTFISYGAHFVIDDLRELDEIIENINSLIPGPSK